MQNLVGYSDSDDERSPGRGLPPAAGPSRAPQAGAPLQQPAHLSAPSSAPPAAAALNRIKGAASRGASPLVGVNLPTSSSNSPRPSPTPHTKRRGSSSPPPAPDRPAPQSTADRNAQQAEAAAATPNEQREREQRSEVEGSAAPPDVRLDTLAEFGIPPVPTGPYKPSVQAKLANFHALRLSRGLHFNDSLHASKAFRNPRIYAKLVEFVDVDETGTNWARGVWDPKGLPADATAARIAAEQKARSEARAAQPAGSRSSIAFTSSSSSAPPASSSVPRNGRDDRDRRDKDRDRERDRERDRGGKKGSRWDRERSRSPRRR